MSEPTSGVSRPCGQSPHGLDAAPASGRLWTGVGLIRAGEYFAAHEELEDAWRSAPDEERDFLQGLVHVAVAWYQARRKNRVGMERQLEKAIRRLSPYAPAHRGVDLDPLLAQLRELRERGSLELPPPQL